MLWKYLTCPSLWKWHIIKMRAICVQNLLFATKCTIEPTWLLLILFSATFWYVVNRLTLTGSKQTIDSNFFSSTNAFCTSPNPSSSVFHLLSLSDSNLHPYLLPFFIYYSSSSPSHYEQLQGCFFYLHPYLLPSFLFFVFILFLLTFILFSVLKKILWYNFMMFSNLLRKYWLCFISSSCLCIFYGISWFDYLGFFVYRYRNPKKVIFLCNWGYWVLKMFSILFLHKIWTPNPRSICMLFFILLRHDSKAFMVKYFTV